MSNKKWIHATTSDLSKKKNASTSVRKLSVRVLEICGICKIIVWRARWDCDIVGNVIYFIIIMESGH
jgi:hypothetical protein